MKLVKTDRSIIVYILLSIFTLGLYGFVFVHGLAKDVNTMCADDGKTTQGLLVYLLLTLLTCGIYSIFWWYGVSERIHNTAARRNIANVDISGGTFLLWYLLGCFVCTFLIFVAFHKLFEGCNNIGNEYNTCVRSGLNPYAPVGSFYAQQPPMGGQWQ